MYDNHLNPKHTAIVVVDMQNDYCHEQGALGTMGRNMEGSQRIVPAIDGLLNQARQLKIPVIFIQTIQDPHLMSDVWKNRPSINGADSSSEVCAKGSWGADFYKLSPASEDIIVEKYRYSAFTATGFDMILRNLGVKSLIFTGVATNVCVESSARDAFMHDYFVTLVKDCCAGYIPELHEAAIRNVEVYFGLALHANQIIEHWNTADLKILS